ncbi:methyltransferase family protein [Parasphingorhabdus halotolerans]|uniref:Isoprenylcysteine carboxylmethyltransferase family protein n=1 Tax=Parasphingorhabdus halotolerans TaxID=2725558 RepID=A0A6H2DK06_9SPHN|nr:isoprenylcysteine carboxylmethyltransferase family protein [Parasphingorhabdus halotolerans]QJB69009.1 isoprenylcysteine carboxylmethyltransferase family protein [Parasphingorhabdus halotolerans]
MSDIPPPAVKFPPPLLYLGAILFGWLLDYLLPIPAISLSDDILRLLGAVLLLAGIAVNIGGVMQFKKQKENVIPWTGSEKMIAEGIYKITRNPMYLGMTLIVIAVGLFFGNYAVMGLGLVAAIIIDRLVITREEAYLEARFGQSYADYKTLVRRWI